MKLTQVRRFSVAGMLWVCTFGVDPQYATAAGKGTTTRKNLLRIHEGEDSSKFEVFRENGTEPILTQVARSDERPYIHPVVAPGGNGILTEYRPTNHPHQTGI